MKIAVMGAGAMGSLYGGRLVEAGQDVTLIDVVPELVATLNARGLRMDGLGGDRIIRVKAATRAEEVGKVDLVIFFVKSQHSEAAAVAARPLFGEDTVALTLQNGLGHVPKLTKVLGQDRVIQGVAHGGATVRGLAHVSLTWPSSQEIGELDGRITDRLHKVAGVLNSTGFKTIVTDRIQTYVWGKLLINVGMNAICAVSGLLDGEMIDSPEAMKYSDELIREAAAVARALGVQLPQENPSSYNIYREKPEINGKPSTMQDLEKGKPTEIDALNGAIAAEGQRLGVPTPYNQAITYMVKMIEQRHRMYTQ